VGSRQLVAGLAADDRLPAEVLAAIGRVPRDLFVPVESRRRAWDDVPLAIGAGQTISQPTVVALMSAAAQLAPGDSVLEVGTGSGYQTAVLAELIGLGPGASRADRRGRLASVEILRELAKPAGERLRELGYGEVALRIGDGSLGWPERAPFDAVLVTAAAPHVPEELTRQLAVGGRLVIPVGGSDLQELLVVEKSRTGLEVHREGCWVRFVPLVGGIEDDSEA
jgi:protein-L-isoaspartate(D-aspartate) O-methyltransferase